MRAVADPRTLAAAAWAFAALRSARRQLASGRLGDVRIPAPPRLPAAARRGVDAVLRRRGASCLERSLVQQRWLAAHGEPRAVVVGVSAPSEFTAHAWLEGEPVMAEYHEIARLAP